MLGLRAGFPLRLCVSTTETRERIAVQYERESGGIVRMVCADAETIAHMLCHFLHSWLLVKEAGFLKALPAVIGRASKVQLSRSPKVKPLVAAIL